MTGLSAVTLFNLYAEHTMRNARLDGLQAEIKIGGRKINNLRYVGDTTLKQKEPLDEGERAGLRLNIKKN